MRAWLVTTLLLLGGLSTPGAAAQGSGCASITPGPSSEPRAVTPEIPWAVQLRHARPSSCLNPPPNCPDSSSQVTFSAPQKPAYVTVTFSSNPAPVTPSGSSMEARTTATFRLDPHAPNRTLFQVMVTAGCGAYQASQTYPFATAPFIDVNWTVLQRTVGPGTTNWTIRFLNTGSRTAFVDFRPIPREGPYVWTGINHTIQLGGLSKPTIPSSLELHIAVNTTRARMELGIELLIADSPGGEGAKNHTLILYRPGAFEGRARAPSLDLLLVLGICAAVLVLRKRPA